MPNYFNSEGKKISAIQWKGEANQHRIYKFLTGKNYMWAGDDYEDYLAYIALHGLVLSNGLKVPIGSYIMKSGGSYLVEKASEFEKKYKQ